MKRRITLVVESRSYIEEKLRELCDVIVESVDDIPDPDRVQEFRVRIVTKATDKATVSPHQAYHVFNRLTKADFGWPFMPEAVTVTEVDPTEVPDA